MTMTGFIIERLQLLSHIKMLEHDIKIMENLKNVNISSLYSEKEKNSLLQFYSPEDFGEKEANENFFQKIRELETNDLKASLEKYKKEYEKINGEM